LERPGETLDFFGGSDDLLNGRLRHTSQAFGEDPLRVLRGFHFCGRFNLTAEADTLAICQQLSAEFNTLPIERIWTEWQKWATKSMRPSAGLRFLQAAGWLAHHPELNDLVGCEQELSHHPEGWSFKFGFSPFESSFASPAETIRIDDGFSWRKFLSASLTETAMIPGFGGATNAQTLMDSTTDGFTSTDLTGAFGVSLSSESSVAIHAKSKCLMWKADNATIFTHKTLRIIFEIPSSRMIRIVDSAIDDFQVIENVIHPIAVYMMNMFPSLKTSANAQLHKVSVKGDGPPFIFSIAGKPNALITSIVLHSESRAIDNNILCHFDLALEADFDFGHLDASCAGHDTKRRLICQVTIGDAWDHTLHTVDAMADICERENIGGDARVVLMLAALLHDVGKPATTEFNQEKGNFRNYGHDQAGAEPARAFLEVIGAHASIIERVLPLVTNHMRHVNFHTGGEPGPRHARRLARDLAPATMQEWAFTVEADHSGRPPLAGGLPEPAVRLLEIAEEQAIADAAPRCPLMGRHLIQMGLTPGPEFGVILGEAAEAFIEGEFETAEQGMAWAEGR
jgi:putative nucleotidyltransferase with HDIG domain